MVLNNTLRAWVIIAKNNFQNQLLTPSSSILFIIGKLLTFVFTLFTIFAIFSTTSFIKGYSLSQAVIVTIVFNFMDSFIQFFFRSIYSFRPVLLRGDYDLDLLKPLPSFFRPLIAGPDFLDLPSLVVQLSALVYFLNYFHFLITPLQIISFLFYFATALIIAFSLHLLMAAFSILTTEIDNIAWIYRSLMRAGIIPTDIYFGPFRFILDYIIPVTIIVTVPAKALLDLLSPTVFFSTTLFAFFFFTLSWLSWQFSLRRYTSASS